MPRFLGKSIKVPDDLKISLSLFYRHSLRCDLLKISGVFCMTTDKDISFFCNL